MKRLMLFLLIVCGGPAVAQDVIVRGRVEPESGAVIGQHVRVMVDVLFKGTMPHPPRVVLGDTPGAQIVRFETQATTMSDRIDGENYVGQRFEFALYARRGGQLRVPPATVTLLDAKGNETGKAAGQAIGMEIAVPSGVDPAQPVIATTSASLEQRWSPEPTGPFKAGDALVRTITRTAEDVPAMAMRELEFTAPAGVRVYRDRPRTDDRQNRGEVVGRRVDRVTYVFETGGSFALPAVVQPWWNLDSKSLRRAEGAGVTIEVAAPPAPVDWRPIALLAAVAAAIVAGIVWLGLVLRARWRQSEIRAFRRMLAVSRHGDVAAAYRAFGTWRRHLPHPSAATSLGRQLEEVLFGGAAWSPDAFVRQARVLRAELRRGERREQWLPALPPLNPTTKVRGGLT